MFSLLAWFRLYQRASGIWRNGVDESKSQALDNPTDKGEVMFCPACGLKQNVLFDISRYANGGDNTRVWEARFFCRECGRFVYLKIVVPRETLDIDAEADERIANQGGKSVLEKESHEVTK